MSEPSSTLLAHLREVARVPVRGDRFALHGDRLVVGSLHAKAPHELSIVALAPITEPRVLARLPFRYQMQALTIVGDVAYVFEYSRAIHLVRLDDLERLAAFDCHLMFKQQVYQFAPVGPRWLVAARNWQGVSVLDVADPAHPRETVVEKLGESFVEGLAVAGDRIFAAAHADGLVELRVNPDGTLVEVGRWLGGDDGFSVQKVFVVGDRLWVFGNGALPYARPEPAKQAAVDGDGDEDGDEDGDDAEDVYEEPEDDPDTVVFALADLATPVWFGASGRQPRQVAPLPDGGAIVLEGYRCLRFPAAGKPELLFTRHEDAATHRYIEVPPGTDRHELGREVETMDDALAWARYGDHLLVQQSDELVVYAIDPGSPLARMG